MYRHVIPVKWYSEIPEKQQNHVKLFAGHLLYYGRNVHCTSRFVVYPSSFFVLWVLMNQSFQSPHLEVGMVSLLYESATEQLTVFIHNFQVILYFDMSTTCQDFITDMSTWKRSWRQPYYTERIDNLCISHNAPQSGTNMQDTCSRSRSWILAPTKMHYGKCTKGVLHCDDLLSCVVIFNFIFRLWKRWPLISLW